MATLVDEEDLINKSRNPGADERADPVHPVAAPTPAYHRGAKGDGGVHGGAGEGAAGQDVGPHYEANGDRGNCANVALLWINCSRIHCVNQPKCHHYFEHHCTPHCDS